MALEMQGFVNHGAAECAGYLDDPQAWATMDSA